MSLRFKRHYLLILLFIFVLTFFVLVMGDQRIIAYTTANSGKLQQNFSINYMNDVYLFDDSLVHDIQLVMSPDEYDVMIATFKETGLKEYFHADVIIDGVRVNNVGVRLKGNASLSTALGTGFRGNHPDRPSFGQFSGGEIPQMWDGFQPPMEGQLPGMPSNGERHQMPDGFQPGQLPGVPSDGEMPQMPDGFQPPDGQFPNAPSRFGQLASDEVKIPYLIKFDEYVDGQAYQGYTSLAVRNYGTSFDAAMLQEPVTNNMVRLSGLPATQTAYTGFHINNDAETLYVISEILDEEYLTQHFEKANGVLYKAELGSTLSYQGDDPSSYANSFTQKTRVNDADLAPLIAFIRFLSEADDATFARELPYWLDVNSFAAYLAINNLLVNTDSIIGMNNNYYLYYDDITKRFTLLMWDANESLGKLAMGNSSANYDLYFTSQGRDSNRGLGGHVGPGGGQNVLFERFIANDEFKALYVQKLQVIYQQVFASNAIVEQIDKYQDLIHQVNAERNLVDTETYDQAVQKVLDFVNQRMEYLSTTELLAK